MNNPGDERIPWNIFSVILLGALLGPFGSIVVSVALPTVARDFQIDIQSAKWVVLIYLVVTTFMLPVAGRLSRSISEEWLFKAGLLIAALGTLMSGCAPPGNLGFLIVARGVTGIGTAAVFALFASLVTKYVPQPKRGMGFGIVGATVAVALVTGVIAGAAISEMYGWRWVFWIQTPFQVAGFILGLLHFPPTPVRPVANFPYLNSLGWFILTWGLVMVLDAYAKGILVEWLPLTITLTAAGIVLFVSMERRGNSLFDYSLFSSRGYSLGVLGIGLINMVVFVLTLFVPFFLEEYVGLSAAQMGRYLGIIPLATLIIAPLAGRYSDRRGARGPVFSGLVLAIAGFSILASIGFSGNLGSLSAGLLLVGVASGLFSSPLMALMMSSVSVDRRGVASGLGSLARNLGFLLGTSLGSLSLSLLLWRYGGIELMRLSQQAGLTPENVSAPAFTYALRGLMLLCVLVCLVGLLFMIRLPNNPDNADASGSAVV